MTAPTTEARVEGTLDPVLADLRRERDLFKAGFLAAMEWYGCDQDEIERCSVSVSDDIESGMIDKTKGETEHRCLKAMWNALTDTSFHRTEPAAGAGTVLVRASGGSDAT